MACLWTASSFPAQFRAKVKVGSRNGHWKLGPELSIAWELNYSAASGDQDDRIRVGHKYL